MLAGDLGRRTGRSQSYPRSSLGVPRQVLTHGAVNLTFSGGQMFRVPPLPQWRGSDNLLRSPGSGARHSPAHRLDAVGAEGRSRRVRRRRGAREGLSPLSARGVGQAPAAAQPSRKSQPSSPDANPVQEVAGTVVRHGWVPLGPTERPPGARQTCFWALFQRSRANHSWHEPAVMAGTARAATR